MAVESVDIRSLSGALGLENGYTKRPMTELFAEVELLWLMDVGLLRREVDGQGLTNSFRVTPLGRQLISKWRDRGRVEVAASWRDRFYNAVSRWFRLPF